MLSDALAFESLGHGDDVPANFLPAALPVLLGRADDRLDDRLDDGLVVPVLGEDGEGGLRLLYARGEDIRSPDRLAQLSKALGNASDAPATFGPAVARSVLHERSRSIALPAGRRRGHHPSFAGAPVEVGVIDAGIAFWAPMFGDAFASFAVLDLEGDDPAAVRALPAAELALMRARGGSDAGDRANRRALATGHPGCVHAVPRGTAPIVTAAGLSHGIAVAALVREAGREAGAELRLHGLDLPRSVLRDASGTALRGVLDAAVRGVANLAAAHHPPDRPLHVVIVLAFGFLGGPQEGGAEADVLRRLHRTIALYREIGIEVTLVVPMGNHLQDRAHAVLSAGDSATCRLDWRVLPDDHSANTIDLYYPEGIPALTIEAPDGRRGTRPAGAETAHLFGGPGGPFGATWTVPVGDGLSRTRISLAPTASRTASQPLAPFGRWRISLACAKAEAWILRDDAAFDDRAAPRRRSWFEDRAYRDRDRLGLPAADDAQPTSSAVRRAGTASVLAASRDPSIVPVGAQWHPPGAAGPATTRYGGAFVEGHPRQPEWAVVETRGPAGGRETPGSASGRLFRLSGTSVAAAIHGGLLAWNLSP